MAKIRSVKGQSSTSRKVSKAKNKQTRTARGVAKPQSRGSSTPLKAAKKVADKSKRCGGISDKRLDSEMDSEEMRVQAASKAKTKQGTPMTFAEAQKTSTAAGRDSSAAGIHATNTRASRKSHRIEAGANGSSTNHNAATVLEVPRPRAKFSPKERNKSVGIILADIGNWTTIVCRILGDEAPELFDSWKGVALQRNPEIRTRAVAKLEDEKWRLVFGPETNLACDTERKTVVFDDLKLSMNPKSEQFQLRLEKEKKIGIENVSQRYIEWVFRTVFDASGQDNTDISRFLVYTALPPEWPEQVLAEYCQIITNIPGWEGKVKVLISCEQSTAAIGRLKPLMIEQRKSLGVYLKDLEHAGILDLGDATANVGVIYSESYQPVAAATELFGFGLLNKIVEDILGPSEWLAKQFGTACKEHLQQWMQTEFLLTHKPNLGSGTQHTLEITNHKVPDELANQIEAAVLDHFDKVIDFTLGFFDTWSKRSGIKVKSNVQC